jgi:glycosyltransferase involved in cell wall biosynthesis
VEPERNGLLVDGEDHEALAAAAMRLLDDGELAQRVIAEGLADVERRYTWTVVADQWVSLYQGLAGVVATAPKADEIALRVAHEPAREAASR